MQWKRCALQKQASQQLPSSSKLTRIKMAHTTVEDSGPGIDAHTAQQIFEPFFTTKSSGIGMGLAISRALIEANGGQLWLEVNGQPKTAFHFTLPFAAGI
jgi:two-component system sensor kinase FixL